LQIKLTFPLPHLTSVPINATFLTDPSSPDEMNGSGDFLAGSVSPVKLDSSQSPVVMIPIQISLCESWVTGEM